MKRGKMRAPEQKHERHPDTAHRRHLGAALFIGIHLLTSGVVATAFARQFGQRWLAVPAHVLVVAEWDALLLLVLATLIAFLPERGLIWARVACRVLPAATFTFQIYLYALDAVSNAFWGRNITGHLVVSFVPTVWSGKEPLPVSAAGIGIFTAGVLASMALASRWWGPVLY